MDDYTFRGQPISGPAAYVLLGSIKRVLQDAPNPTPEDILQLQKIVEDFSVKLEEDLIRSYQEIEEEDK
jgi:hypothetical protein